MNKYTYKNVNTKQIVFECCANDIIGADKEYEKRFGVGPDKQSNVVVLIDNKQAVARR